MSKIIHATLGDIGSVRMCKRVLKEQTSDTGDIPFYKISTFGGKADTYISREMFEDYKERFNYPKAGDILISAAGTLGRTVIYNGEESYFQDSNIVWIENDETKVLNRYLYYFYRIIQWKKTTGSTIERLYNENIAGAEIFYPESIEEQEKVIAALSAIDSKISTNNRLNSELESLAKTIYDYWFLQFEFPNEEGKPYKSSGGKMVWNDELKREIPEGWNMCDIQDCCEIIDCLHSKKPEYKYDNENSYLLTLDNLTSDGNIDISKKYYISNRDFLKWTSKITVAENDFVVTNAGRAGDVCKIPAGVKCAIGRNITAIHPVEINPYYLRQYFKSGYFSQQVKKNLDCGSFFKSFNVKSIKVLKILMPKGSIYDTYIDIITPIIQTIELKIQENQKLASLRDFLLPMLMNGQVTFKEKK